MTDRSRRRPWLAALLAFVIPGLGHVYLRRWARAFGWYVAVTATLVLIVPDGAVEQLTTSDPPPVGDVAPALLVTAASVIDAYVLALRNNREYERDRRTTEGDDPESTTEGTDPATTTDRSTGDAEADADVVSCPHCGRETDASFDFCQWCAEPVSE